MYLYFFVFANTFSTKCEFIIVFIILTSKPKMENVEVERAHRDGKLRSYKGKPVHRHTLIKLLRYKDKINTFNI